jgi:C4-dicarboxylate-specific signal transduction histidine kinase
MYEKLLAIKNEFSPDSEQLTYMQTAVAGYGHTLKNKLQLIQALLLKHKALPEKEQIEELIDEIDATYEALRYVAMPELEQEYHLSTGVLLERLLKLAKSLCSKENVQLQLNVNEVLNKPLKINQLSLFHCLTLIISNSIKNLQNQNTRLIKINLDLETEKFIINIEDNAQSSGLNFDVQYFEELCSKNDLSFVYTQTENGNKTQLVKG